MTTEIKTGAQPKAVELAVPRIKAGGWLAFSRINGLWRQIYPDHTKNVDWARHPNPLHASKEDAVEAAQGYMAGHAQGGTIKVFYVELDE